MAWFARGLFGRIARFGRAPRNADGGPRTSSFDAGSWIGCETRLPDDPDNDTCYVARHLEGEDVLVIMLSRSGGGSIIIRDRAMTFPEGLLSGVTVATEHAPLPVVALEADEPSMVTVTLAALPRALAIFRGSKTLRIETDEMLYEYDIAGARQAVDGLVAHAHGIGFPAFDLPAFGDAVVEPPAIARLGEIAAHDLPALAGLSGFHHSQVGELGEISPRTLALWTDGTFVGGLMCGEHDAWNGETPDMYAERAMKVIPHLSAYARAVREAGDPAPGDDRVDGERGNDVRADEEAVEDPTFVAMQVTEIDTATAVLFTIGTRSRDDATRNLNDRLHATLVNHL